MMNSQSSPTLDNVTFRNNNATRGAGMYHFDSSPTLTNVTFYQNTATPCPIPPELVAPADGSTVHGSTVHFHWTKVTCATRCVIRIRRDSPSGPVVFKRKRLPESKLDVDFSERGSGTCFWRMRACEKKVCSNRSDRWHVLTIVSKESWQRDDWTRPGQSLVAMR